jgi:uncharacterized protein (TIGR02466 family)
VNIFTLFPTAVGKFQLDRELTKQELKFIADAERRPNMGNQTSVNNYILKEKPLKKLGDFLLESANKYLTEVYKPRDDVKLYITQSWLNYTEKGGYHHKHAHPNSFISGVFYISADVTKDKIFFYGNEQYKQIKLDPIEFNLYNSESWWLEVGVGVLYLFPSSLTHMVETVQHEETRISLSFNTFLKGTIGSNHNLTELLIEE